MKIKIQFTLIVLWTSVYSLYDKSKESRKHYGLSFHVNCKNYEKTFKCLTACKSIGYQIFRMNRECKCTCHEMKTSTILPFFKWRTNGTTRSIPKTRSPRLYHIVGTLSPPPDSIESTTMTDTSPACVYKTATFSNIGSSNEPTGGPDKGNTTEEEAGGDKGQNKSDATTIASVTSAAA